MNVQTQILFLILSFSLQSQAATFTYFVKGSDGPAGTSTHACAISAPDNGFVEWADDNWRCNGQWKFAWASETDQRFKCAVMTNNNGFVEWADDNWRCNGSKESINYFASKKATTKKISRLPDDSQLVLAKKVDFPSGEKCIHVSGKSPGFFGANNSCEICVTAESHNDRRLVMRSMIVKETELSDDGRSAVFTIVNDRAVEKINCQSDGQIDPFDREKLKIFLESMGLTLTLPPPEEF